MKNLTKMTETENRAANGGGRYCKICGYGNDSYKSWADIAKHIIRKHFGVFCGTYAYNIWKYRKVLAWAIGL